MGNSTTSLQSVIDVAAAKGIGKPLAQPTGYNTTLALTMASDVMADIVCERFNFKWNSQLSTPFYINSYQQDYPGMGTNIGWLEDCDRVDINNTSYPKPVRQMTARRQLSRSGFVSGPIREICWMYNGDMYYGNWPGANQVYYPLIGTQPTKQNGPMAFIDVNNNILVLTTFGTTGSTQPAAPAASAQGVTVTDGSCVWTVVSATSQGFRVWPLPGGTGPVYQVTPKFQLEPPIFKTLGQLLNPIPDSFARYFRRGWEIACKDASANPKDKDDAMKLLPVWMKDLLDAAKQGDKEVDAYGLVPAIQAVDSVYSGLRNPQDPAQPY